MDDNTPFDYCASGCSREAFDVRFMYFSAEELRRISVHKVDSVISFDEHGDPMEEGLHPPQLGPLGKKGAGDTTAVCKTCGMEKDCPGHIGHIDLACPVYNPFLLTAIYKLLQKTCHACCKLRVDPTRTKELLRMVQELMPGTLVQRGTPMQNSKKRSAFLSECIPDEHPGIEVIEHIKPDDDGTSGKPPYRLKAVPKRTMEDHSESASSIAKMCSDAAAEQQVAAEAAAKAKGDRALQKVQESSQIESLRVALAEYVADFSNVCPFCKVRAAKWRKEGHSQLYMKKHGDKEDMLCLPVFVRDLLRSLWENDSQVLRWLVPGSRESGADIFFLEALAVPPNRFRMPEIPAVGQPRLSVQTTQLRNIVMANDEVKKVVQLRKESEAATEAGEAGMEDEDPVQHEMALKNAVAELQIAVNCLMDGSKSEKHKRLSQDGIRQKLERKEGLFRMKMMGKRVNFAARSVISPDPNIETSEIGVPLMIAENLYYPEVAAPHNAEKLRELVMRGKKYPGAAEVHIPDQKGGKTVMRLGPTLKEEKREAIAKQLITDIESGKPPMTVFRQLRDGDPLLVNRQPTLHKPGIMAHTAKVLRSEKTIRLHYVNCNTYNADFDGDEMNLHAPQDPIGRMEALGIARADRQYLVPTSGKPLRGLIQDHIIAGTMLTKRDTFYGRSEVCLLLYGGLRAALDHLDLPHDLKKRPGADDADMRTFPQRRRLHLDPPTLWKPRAVWTGKQVFSMLLKNIIILCDKGRNPLTKDGLFLESKSKTPGDIWNGRLDGDKEESQVLFQDSDLLRGVLDKNQFGASMMGITHILFELMGGHVVSVMLASVARLFTLLLQMRGFTCAFADLLLTKPTEDKRRQLIVNSRSAAKSTAEKWLDKQHRPEFLDGNAKSADLSEAAADLLLNSTAEEQLEGMMIGAMKKNWSDMINQCIPIGQKLPFPRNCFASMVQTGAKGSSVNHSQVSCCLGQQELEGRLPPLMATRRALPCFAPNDLASRTRGYISDRFLTGIRPQEFFFHCMAGREGLVDTAVKTSRSGYLQRCLVKHLESLKVSYDLSVRDSDGAVVQFLYGEDGVDVTRATYLFKFKELWANFKLLRGSGKQQMDQLKGTRRVVDLEAAPQYMSIVEAAKGGKDKKAVKLLRSMIAASQRRSFSISGCGLVEFNGEYTEQKDVEGDEERLSYCHVDRAHLTCFFEEGAWYLVNSASGKDVKCYRSIKDLKQLPSGGWEVFRSGKEPPPTLQLLELDSTAQHKLQCAVEKLKALKAQDDKGRMADVMDPASSVLTPSHYFGSTSELHEQQLRKFIDEMKAKKEMTQQDAEDFADFMHLKFMRCLAEPGEAVGVIAAQSMGEPSTQMTLNTFHLAGHGGANVTLGIPRLREIIQTGSKSCSTPVMKIKVVQDANAGKSLEQRMTVAEKERVKFRRVTLLDCLARLAVNESIQYHPTKKGIVWVYHCRFEFLPIAEICKRVPHISPQRLEATMTGLVCRRLKVQLKKIIQTAKQAEAAAQIAAKKGKEEGEDVAGVVKVSADKEEEADDAEEAKPRKRRKVDVRGAEDKANNEEVDDEAAENEDEEDDDDDDEDAIFGEDSGMEENKDEDMDEDDNAGATPQKVKPEVKEEKVEGKEDEVKVKREQAEGESPPVKEKKGKAKEPKEQELSGLEALQQALRSGDIVWHSKLVDDAMTIIVTHRYQDCPHNLFVGDVLHNICKDAELQDPACQGVSAVHVQEDEGQVYLQCEGINLFGLQALPPEMFDHRTIYTNNIVKVLETYGCEAARAAIVREVQSVFGPYGIQVDSRHLALIADYMSAAGGIRAFNRHGMMHNASPFLQMSFETTMQFMTSACQEGLSDSMKSPASAIVLGQLPPVGTGMVSLLVDLKPEAPQWKNKRVFFKEGR